MRATSLNATRRANDLALLAGGHQLDLLVVGGGVTGAGVALDAAARGLSVALVEAHDLAFGTSRFSSKLVHGGLRYLAHGEFGLARESAVERGLLMTRTAPHLVRTLPQLIPLHRPARGAGVRRSHEAVFMAGLRAGDLLRRTAGTPGAVLPAPRRIPAAEALALAGGLRVSGLRGGLLSYDGQLVDDARLVVALARTAAGFGARIITRARAVHLDGSGGEVLDGLTGETVRIRAKAVINATGVWADRLVPGVRLRPSRGSHLVLDGAALGLGGTALTVPVPGERNRFALLLPQLDGRVYLGLTDEPMDGPVPEVPEVPQADVDFLLDVANTVLGRRLGPADVLGAFAGLRPLIDLPGTSGRTADLSRKHAVLTSPDGVTTVVGGKLTTYRRMAADAVDAAIARRGLSAGPSRSEQVPLVGAAPAEYLSTMEVSPRLVARYGAEAVRLAALAQLDPRLGAEVADGLGVTAAEVVWAVRHEGALDADDVLDRRSRIGLVPSDRLRALDSVTALVRKATEGL
ncbi:glycerol-3-phosphate dehydrogenase/oxidase [Crossiella sp. CA-258035]|uniref:glycerol-3-phosphate dehydrogenase/oxidase n=1 Tax=Crossiella sp. CA-258035 TaxID=2981138 RepID=UPI0024BC6262|nr:glycerol-3-phosphate dehydrogenase/oxidase [Crossiella sp. CA-258035]WHT23455.1 glycerol-3-phosphate dehydrogenase/oxidase [Crossiella sp. CA-258035]